MSSNKAMNLADDVLCNLPGPSSVDSTFTVILCHRTQLPVLRRLFLAQSTRQSASPFLVLGHLARV